MLVLEHVRDHRAQHVRVGDALRWFRWGTLDQCKRTHVCVEDEAEIRGGATVQAGLGEAKVDERALGGGAHGGARASHASVVGQVESAAVSVRLGATLELVRGAVVDDEDAELVHGPVELGGGDGAVHNLYG